MNKRTEKLAEQCRTLYRGGNGQYVEQFDEQKFAELIVAECMEVFSRDLPEPGDGKMLEVINRVCAVAEHFGVEE